MCACTHTKVENSSGRSLEARLSPQGNETLKLKNGMCSGSSVALEQ